MNQTFTDQALQQYRKIKERVYRLSSCLLLAGCVGIGYAMYQVIANPLGGNRGITAVVFGGSVVIAYFAVKEALAIYLQNKKIIKAIKDPQLFLDYRYRPGTSFRSMGFMPLVREPVGKSESQWTKIFQDNRYQLIKGAYLETDPIRFNEPLSDEMKRKLVYGLGARFLSPDILYQAYIELASNQNYDTEQFRANFDEIWYHSLNEVMNYQPKVKKALQKAAKKQLKADWDIESKDDLLHSLERLSEGTYEASEEHLEMVHQLEGLEQVKTFFGFDLGRYVNVIRNGIYAGYLVDQHEVNQLLQEGFELLTSNFENYTEFIDSYLAGVYIWNKGMFPSIRILCLYILMNPYSPAYLK